MNNLIASNHVLRLDFIAELPDDLLLDRVRELAARARLSTAELVAHLAEVDLRRLYLGRGCSSMFTYCTEVLHLSESAAYTRIEVARAVRRLPRLLQLLADGSLSLTAIRRLASVLTTANFDRVVLAARHRTAREVDELIARERPKSNVPSTIRRLPRQAELVSRRVANRASREPRADDQSLGFNSVISPTLDRDRASIQPLATERHRVQFTASGEMRDRIQRLQDLLRHRIPDGDIAAVIDTALIELLAKLEQQKCGAASERKARRDRLDADTAASKPPTRTIPRALRLAVWRRDAGRCAFVSTEAKRCSATGFLEFHHVAAFARGGGTTAANLELRCRAHNVYEAELAGLGRRVRHAKWNSRRDAWEGADPPG